MGKTLDKTVYASLLFFVFALAACSTNKESKPMEASQAVKAPPAKPNPDVRAAQSSTSLDSLKRGEAPVTPPGSALKEIYFAFDKYDLSTDARATLQANSASLKKNPAARIEIEGHCDERGTSEYNLALGAKRAQVAKDYLATLGIPAGRISTNSYGEEIPVCREHNEACWQKNRRDRFVVFKEKPGV
jgi:peptidoglycan-associated lipoprotein